MSKKVFTPITQFKVLGLAKSIHSKPDPSNLVLTVVPKDDSTFDDKNLDENEYEIINGRHRYLALKNLDEKGLLESVAGLADKRVTCYILRTTCPIQSNYGWNEAQAAFVRKRPTLMNTCTWLRV